MLIKDVPPADYNQLFDQTVMFYKKQNRWVQVRGFTGTKVLIKFLDDRTETLTLFNDENFSTEHPKLGMVNIRQGCTFVSRIPKRIMKAALCQNTMAVDIPFKDRSYFSGIGFRDLMYEFPPEIINTFLGIYPSFEEAVALVAKRESFAVAFDRQFCVSYKGDIYFKGNPVPVGNIKIDLTEPANLDKIEWVAGLSPLRIIIGDACAKTLQSFKQAPATRLARG